MFYAKLLSRQNYVCCDKYLSRQKFCCEKHVFVATNIIFSRQAYFCRIKHLFVATILCLSRQNFGRDKNDTCGSSRQYYFSCSRFIAAAEAVCFLSLLVPLSLESRFGLAVRREAGKRKDLGSVPLRLSFLFKSCGLWTRSCDFVPHN